MSHHRIETRNLCFSYPDRYNLSLNNISLKIGHGESVAILGENGAGKTTFMLHLNGSLMPNSGSLVIGDLELTKKNLPIIRQTVGLVFQDPDDQLFMGSVHEDVSFGPINMGLSREEIDKRVEKALSTVDILPLRTRSPHKLSAGEKKRAAIASILSMEPKIIAMDEPSTNLDPKSRRTIITILKNFHHTKIIATHDLAMAAELCERTIIFHKGRVADDGPTSQLLSNKKLLKECSLEG
jgi:cobalt/nickel transport system ATP-binding protein